jgi:predicted component of type VI protein secretion system
MKAELVPNNGDPPIPITRDLTVVGRREYCDVVINHHSLSKRHCVLVRTDGLLMVRDLATTNGTKVNGQKVLWAALLPNDRLTLGRYKVRIYLGPDDAPSPSEEGRPERAQSPAHAPGATGPMFTAAGFAAPSPAPAVPAVPVPQGPRTPTDHDVILDGNDLLFDDSDDEPAILELD